MLRSRSILLALIVAGLVLFSGCRTYGDEGYGTTSKNYAALEQTVQSFEAELKQAKSDLEKLESAATDADTLQGLADRFREVVEEHTSLLEKQHNRVERYSPDASYRDLSNAYGATVTEQRLVQQKYQRVVRTVRAIVQGVPVQETKVKSDRRYTIRPIGFPPAEERGPRSMEQALRGL